MTSSRMTRQAGTTAHWFSGYTNRALLGRGRCLGVAVSDGDFVELDEASWSAGAQRGDGGYEGVDVVGLQVRGRFYL